MSENESNLLLYQMLRSTVSTFDPILVSLLTQGNTFVIAVLSIPLVANMEGIQAGIISLFALVFGLFLLLANMLYLNLLKRAVLTAQKIEEEQMSHINDDFKITLQLNKIPFSARKGANFIYLVLPVLWICSAFVEGIVYLSSITGPWLIFYILISLLIVVTGIALYGIYLKNSPVD